MSPRGRPMPPAPPIRCWNRAREREEEEPICGERALRWLYETRAGRLLAESVLSRRVPSRIFGWLQSTRWSRRWIPSFTERFGIDPSEFEDEDYRSFNDFFTRRFKEGARSFCSGDELPAFAEGRYLAFESVPGDAELPVKDLRLSL
ncbi:MAG: hypothetical protein JXA90_05450, partial [Planctomycetes bacterium]|nr:hypothetical protein [Planctomycetota bacterium]